MESRVPPTWIPLYITNSSLARIVRGQLVAQLAHLAIGEAGLAVHRNDSASRAYALALAIAYAGLFVLGLIFGLTFLGGLMPLNGPDHILHLLTALVAFGAYFASWREATASTT